jgi:hypothetical protein
MDPTERSETTPKTLDEFRIGRFVYRLRVESHTHLPTYKGATLHGAFEQALAQVSHPLYRRLAQAAPDNGRAVPKPFVLEPPEDSITDYAPGDPLDFGLVLVGNALWQLPACTAAVQEMGRIGLGRGRGTFRLERMDADRPSGDPLPVYADAVWNGFTVPPSARDLARAAERGFAGDGIEIELTTRLRIKSDGRLVRQAPEFPVLWNRLIGRLNMLAWNHHGLRLLDDAAKQDLARRAQAIALTDADTRWS